MILAALSASFFVISVYSSKDRRIPVSELMRFMKANHMPIDALAGTAIRVLLIDGDTQRVEQLVEQLQTKTDYDVQVAESNFQTGTFIHKFEPHVVLISLMDENIDATDICRNIRDDEQLQVIKLIAVANRLSDSEITALLQKGFDSYVSDTDDVDEIVRTIEQATSIVY